MASEKINALIEEVKGLTVLELSELVHALEEEFGVSAAAMAAAAGGAAAPAAEEKTEFDVVLAEVGAERSRSSRLSVEITGLGLAEAKAAVEAAPKAIKEGVSKDEAEELKKKLEEVGAKVELKVSFFTRLPKRAVSASGIQLFFVLRLQSLPSGKALPEQAGQPAAEQAHQHPGQHITGEVDPYIQP